MFLLRDEGDCGGTTGNDWGVDVIGIGVAPRDRHGPGLL